MKNDSRIKNIFVVFMLLLTLNLKGQVFENAKWIGAPPEELPFDRDFLSVFVIDFDLNIADDGVAAILYGIDDPRLMKSNFNIYNLENQVDSSGIKIEFNGKKEIKIYRFGYHPEDKADSPLFIFEETHLKEGNNHVEIKSNSGITDIVVNGIEIGNVVLNPLGRGGDYIPFPVLAKMAVEIQENQNNTIGNIKVKNYREPGNIVASCSTCFQHSGKIEFPIKGQPQLKKDFQIDKMPLKAKITATARGIYDIEVNGENVNNDYFYPGITAYNKTHLYHDFDILPYLKLGENEIKVQLAEGWWSGPSTYFPENWNFFGDRSSFIAKMEFRYENGETDIVVTEPNDWLYSTDGPLLQGSFFQGERYDATRLDGDREWRGAVEIGLDSTVNKSVGSWDKIDFVKTFGDKINVIDTLTAIGMTEPRKGVFIYDMGQNFSGVPYIEFENCKRGETVTLRFSEVLYPEMEEYQPNAGLLMTENLRSALSTDLYTFQGKDTEIFSPRFTSHGYRFIEISGLDEPVPLDRVKSLALSSISKINAHYESSDTLLNRLWNNIVWSALSNFNSIPTDCPQRNERLGWMGDISVFAPTAFQIADIAPLIRQFLTSVRDIQAENGRYPDVAPVGSGFGGILWGSAGITVPWEYYKVTGDIKTIREHYPSMKKYMEYILAETIDEETGIIVQNRDWGDLGDWLSPEYEKNDKSLLWECYFIYDLYLMSEMAKLLDYSDDADHFVSLRDERKKFFVNNYIDKGTSKTVWSGFVPTKKGELVDTQISYVLPIVFEIYSTPEFIENFIETIQRPNVADDGTLCQSYSLMTGFIGTAWISHALSKTGHDEAAYKLLTSTSYPSWLYPVTQGATTIWERLNSYTHDKGFGNNNSMNSFNHYSFGAVGNWLISNSLGINNGLEGEVIIAPEPDLTGSITYAKGWKDTKFGRIESEWRIDDGEISFDISIPDLMRGYFIYKENKIPLKSGINNLRFKI